MKLIGQKKLTDRINRLTLDSFPQAIFLYGRRGCGKHFVCNLIAERLGLVLKELDTKITDDLALQIVGEVQPTLYVIDVNQCSPKLQESLLKLIEEPKPTNFFAFLSTSPRLLLSTIANRCQVWKFERYTKEELQQFLTNYTSSQDQILELATTPGQVQELQQQPLEEIIQLVDNILDKITTASPSNTLHITDKVGFKNEKGKIAPEALILVLRNKLLKRIQNDPGTIYINMYMRLLDYSAKRDLYIVQQRAFDNLLIDLWEAARAV